MLDTEQTDTLGAELKCTLCIFRCICVSADAETTVLVHDVHKLDEERVLRCVHSIDLACIDSTLGSVKREPIAFLIYCVASCERYALVLEVDLHSLAAYDAALTPTTSHESGVRGHTSACGKDTCRSTHTLNILRRCLLTDKDGLLSLSGSFHSSL